ncbi:alpha/beta hydrolase [Burkholderia sp. Ac-20353]|uniref:alpha/beta hydrolase n=1 Tax=Burkholderia sp. Ac-20353 TaxID=2703894 RepID=UPI00197C6C6C|nr:alpha/beta hydrolase [Burkholderia sp. Ac-20353]MBN3790978.1 alpha/beta hydrolase [Burkholderia sp. Ac-20353]
MFEQIKSRTGISRFFCGSLLLASLLITATACSNQSTAQAATDLPSGNPASTNTGSQPISHPKTIVFIHGMFMTPKAWDNWQAYFQKSGYKTIAPAWPLHDGTLEQQRSPEAQAALGKLTLDEVVESYRQVLRQLPEKPIVIGHSMGGLVAQKLLSEGLAAKAVAIDSAPPSGLIVPKWSFIKSNWPVISPFANVDQPYAPSFEDFNYAFANCLPEAEAQQLYRDYGVPESRRVGRGTSEKVAEIDFSKPHGPLLMIAGEDDHIIPAALNLKNFKKYSDPSSVTDFHQFEGQCHALIVNQKWQDVASYVKGWLDNH